MSVLVQPYSCSRRGFLCSLIVVAFVVHMVIIAIYMNHSVLRRLFARPPRGFEMQLGGREKDLLLSAIDAFTEALSAEGIPFFMYGGTLIGSWRHHGQIPWDDDVDFAVPKDLKENVSHILQGLQPDFILNEKQKIRWKFYSPKGAAIPGVSWRFPFLDINFYRLNDSYVWDDDQGNYKNFVFNRSLIFPLTTRPFEGRWLPAPKDTKTMLRRNYQLGKCVTGPYNHRQERIERKLKSINCTELEYFSLRQESACEEW